MQSIGDRRHQTGSMAKDALLRMQSAATAWKLTSRIGSIPEQPLPMAPHELDVIEGGDHSFNILKSLQIAQEDVYRRVLSKALDWLYV